MKPILIFGGTFDPPHLGHLNTVLHLQHYFHFHQIVFLPCKIPVLKAHACANAIDRVHMLEIMIKDYPELTISTIEMDRESPSYMIETLKTFRNQYGQETSITLLLGMDAFLQFHHWHQWKKIPTLANLLIIERQGFSQHSPAPLNEMMHQRCHHPLDILTSAHGKLAVFDAGQYPIASSDLREKMHLKKDVRKSLSPGVYAYIKHHGLYP